MVMLFGCSEDNKSNNAEKIQGLINRAKEFSAKSDYNSAIACYNEIISLDSSNAERYDERAQIFEYASYKDTLNQKLPILQLNDLNKAIVLNATSKRYVARAQYWKRHNENNKALSDFNFAVVNKAEQDEWDPIQKRGWFYFNVLKDSAMAFKDMREAIRIARLSQEFTTREVSLYQIFSVMLMRCKLFSEAEEILEHTLSEIDNMNDKSYLGVPELLAKCKIELGDYFGALHIIDNRDIQRRKLLRGYCLVKLGQREIGLKLINSYKFDTSDPNDGPSKYYLEYYPDANSSNRKVRDIFNWPNDIFNWLN